MGRIPELCTPETTFSPGTPQNLPGGSGIVQHLLESVGVGRIRPRLLQRKLHALHLRKSNKRFRVCG